MGTSIKRSICIRMAAAVVAVLLFSSVTTTNIIRIDRTQEDSTKASALLDSIQRAEVAHYKWSSSLSNALYAGAEFTGSMDHTSCVLGQWLYGETDSGDEAVEQLREQIKPLHQTLHESAGTALTMLAADPLQAQQYYQQTILQTLNSLVDLLDQVVDRGTALNNAAAETMVKTVALMHVLTCVCLALALIALVSMVYFILRHVVRPILLITDATRPLQDGHLRLKLRYHSKNELGELAGTLEESMRRIHTYVDDINRVMAELSQGNFDVSPELDYIGDFRSIEESMNHFTHSLSGALGNINLAQRRVAGNAEQLSSGAQALAQGATQQASAVEELFATVDTLSKSSARNVEKAADVQENARLTSDQVKLSSRQMEEMVAAMADITEASQQIGKIIATIENIAFQTNILALNAAVEAARAGSAGKGFAVVSDEVRNLASKSDEAAKATKDLIENAIQATERGSSIVGQVSQSLERTLDLVVHSNDAIGSIAAAIHEEAESLAQVSEGIGQISSVVQNNSASSEESAAVSTELFEQVHRLEAETKKFRLREGAAREYATH